MFLYELFKQTAQKGLLFNAKIALTPKCNLSCRHCYLGPQQGRILRTEEFGEVISQLARSGVLFLTLTGGEPMMHPGFWEIVSFARRHKFFLRIFTNGTFIDEKAAQRLAGYGVNEIHVSLYGHKPEVHELVTGVSGSFDKTVKAIQLLKRLGMEVQVKSSVMTLNKDHPAEIESFCRGLGVKCSISYLLSPRTDGSEEPFLLEYPAGSETPACVPLKSPAATGEEMACPCPAGEKIEKQHMMEDNTPSPCPAGENSCFVEYDGTLYPCVNYRYSCGNLTKNPLSQLWNAKEMIDVRTGKVTSGQCKNCGAINHCLRCPGLSYHESGRKNGYSRIQCRQTELLENIKEGRGSPGYENIC